jgi:hypothetical protein
MMLAKKLANIVSAKYIPILKRMQGVQVKETGLEHYFAVGAIRKSGGQIEGTSFTITVPPPTSTEYGLYFADIKDKSDDFYKTYIYIATYAPWVVRLDKENPFSADDWRRFYGQMNSLTSRLLAYMVANRIPGTYYVNKNQLILPNGYRVIIKFTLRKIYIRYMDGVDYWENEDEVVADVPSEGDIADIIARALMTLMI